MSALVLYTPLLSPTIVDGVTNITEGTGVLVSGIVQQQVSLANQPIQSLYFPMYLVILMYWARLFWHNRLVYSFLNIGSVTIDCLNLIWMSGWSVVVVALQAPKEL